MNPSTQIAPVSYGRDWDPSYGVDCNTLATLSGVRSDIKDAEAGIERRIAISDTQRQNADLSIHDKVFNAEKAVLEAKFAAVSETKDSERRMTKLMEEKFCDLEKGRLQAEITALRDDRAARATETQNGILTQILNAIVAVTPTA
jgi:hypothetical protein